MALRSCLGSRPDTADLLDRFASGTCSDECGGLAPTQDRAAAWHFPAGARRCSGWLCEDGLQTQIPCNAGGQVRSKDPSISPTAASICRSADQVPECFSYCRLPRCNPLGFSSSPCRRVPVCQTQPHPRGVCGAASGLSSCGVAPPLPRAAYSGSWRQRWSRLVGRPEHIHCWRMPLQERRTPLLQ